MSAATKKPLFQFTGYDDGSSVVIDKNSVVEAHPTTGEQYVNGEPVSQMSEGALLILGLTSTKPQAVDHNTDAGTPSPEVSYNTGGETKIKGSGRTYVTDCVGDSDFDIGAFAAGVSRSFSCVAAGPGDCHGDFILVNRAGDVIAERIKHTDPTITFTGTGDDLVLHVRLDKPCPRMAVVFQN